MSKNIVLAIILVFLQGCIGSKSITVDEKEIANRKNLVEANPDYYLEFIGLKNYSAQDIVDLLKASQNENTIIPQPLYACSALMESKLGFEATSTVHVNSNFGLISVVENEEEYGIIKYSFPADTLDTINEWNAPEVSLNDRNNYNSLGFLSQFIRSDGEKLYMKYKAIYKMVAEDHEKEFRNNFFAHINSLNTPDNYKKARETLKKDGNQINRIWALLILATTKPTQEDLQVQFQEILGPSDYNSTLASTLMLTHIKLIDTVNWELYKEEVKSILSGGALWRYNENLKLLIENNFPADLAQEVFTDQSPVFLDRLNSYHKQAYETPFKLIKMMSENEVKTREEAINWVTALYDK
ncbi:MAG: hypothetical protein ABJR05_09600 [Balneola sp.]